MATTPPGFEEIDIEDLLGDPEQAPTPTQYTVSSYGADLDVHGLINRLERGDIEVPKFQRGYVWSLAQASRFIESLLLGLPVPGIFLSKEEDTQKLLVIDGQQRLMTLSKFYKGSWDDFGKKVFSLSGVQQKFDGKEYRTLSEPDRRRLDNSIIHATIIKQDEPSGDNSSVYQIFQRLNSGGTNLEPQEIRSALFHGSLNDLLRELNENADWRALYGAPSARMKDQEMILRFFALLHDHDRYKRPMEAFLNSYMERNKQLSIQGKDVLVPAFAGTVQVIRKSLGERAFKPKRSFNAAVYDSVMIGLCRRLSRGDIADHSAILGAYHRLLSNEAYLGAVGRSTADENNVASRLQLAIEAFALVA